MTRYVTKEARVKADEIKNALEELHDGIKGLQLVRATKVKSLLREAFNKVTEAVYILEEEVEILNKKEAK